MAYATGSASSSIDLLQKFVAFLAANGWTQDASAAEGTGWRAHLHSSGIYVNLRAAGNEKIWPAPSSGNYDNRVGYGIGLYLGTGYNGSLDWHLQPGHPVNSVGGTPGCGMNLPAGAVTGYHFFLNMGYVIAVVERAPGIFCHLGWGRTLYKIGYANDYPYFFGSSSQFRNVDGGSFSRDYSGITISARTPMCHADIDESGSQFHATAFVKVDASVFTNQWISNPSGASPAYGYTGMMMRSALAPLGMSSCPNAREYVNYNYLLDRAHQAAFTGALILPLHQFLQRPTTLRWAPIGEPYDVGWCTAVGHGYSAKEIYQVGGVDRMLFPGFAVHKVG